MISEKTLVPVGLIGTVVAGAIAWGSMGTRVDAMEKRIDSQEKEIDSNRQYIRSLQNDLMAHLLILRQDVSEIKGELKGRK